MPLSLLLSLAAQASPAEDFILDEYDWYECTPPSDDTWIIRQTHGNTAIRYANPEPRPGYVSFLMEFTGLTMPEPVVQDYSRTFIMADHNPYEVDSYWYLSSSVDYPVFNLQNEFHYGWGTPWPKEINTHQRSIYHTLTGKTEGVSSFFSGSIGTFCRWDDRSYPDRLPEDCFVGWTLCFSHLRPDRVVFNWTIDTSMASRYNEALPNPLMMLHDEASIFVPFYVSYGDVKYEVVSREYDWVNLTRYDWKGGEVSYRAFGDKGLQVYYSGVSFEEIWSSLDAGADE